MQTSELDDPTAAPSVDAAPGRARTPRKGAPDATCTAAVELARAAAVEVGDADAVGEHLGVQAVEERVVSHEFACLMKGYVGWRWTVVTARAPRSKVVTVDEVVLLPGDASLLAPSWLPWSERLRPGDLGPGDILPTPADDIRLAPGWSQGADPALDEDAAQRWELGLGRARVLSREGRDEAADRWYDGDHGPSAPIALAAPEHCATCGFVAPLAGSLRLAFGVCTNAFSPSDGRAVSYDHGCGGHSEALAVATPYDSPLPHVLDDLTLESVGGVPVDHPSDLLVDEVAGLDGAVTPDEELGHS